jgi:hypothetical protein
MLNYAIIKNNIVENAIVVAEEDNESIQALNWFYPDADLIIKETEQTGKIFIGGEFKDMKFRPPAPSPTWIYVEETNTWIPPIPFPEDSDFLWTWNEDDQKWDSHNVELPTE